jgi:hypothetical protein
MAGRAHNQDRNRRRRWSGAAASLAAAVGFALLALAPSGYAQEPPIEVIAPWNAAVTGFSGAPPPPQIAPGEDPAALTFIDPNGPSLRIVDLRHMQGPAAAQLVGAPKPFTVQASQIGQVFGVALDDASPTNIYVAATSAFGLPIVAPGPDGAQRHVKLGAPNATFMSALWGPKAGPGAIWKIDGATARVSLFANVTTEGRTNSGAALGALAFDPDSKSLFVADRESGLIHRFGMNGADLGAYDHGQTGRAAQGLPPAPWTLRQPVDVATRQFDSGDPSTWNLAAPERRVFGLAVHQHRLFYAVADSLQIWSVGLKPDGSFGDDAVIEVAAPPAQGPTEISTIVFDDQGRMLLAERPGPTGAFDFEALAVPAIGRLLRYANVGVAPGDRRVWQSEPDEYAIGFPHDLRNGNGGVAIGLNYDRAGEIIPGSCGGFLWTTGEDLRESSDPSLAERLRQTGPLHVDGLQGMGMWQDRPRNAPPLESYFISYVDGPPDDAARGRLGAVAIERNCTPAQHATVTLPVVLPPGAPPAVGIPPPGAPPRTSPPRGGPPFPPHGPPSGGNPPPPPNSCPPDQMRRVGTGGCEPTCPRPDVEIGGRCCPVATLAAGGECSNSNCPSGQTAIGPSNFCCNRNQVYAGAGGAPACCPGPLVNGKCLPPTPPTCTPSAANPNCCASGYVPAGGSCCLAANLTSKGVCCPAGEAPSGPNKSECLPILHIPIGPLCCAAGLIPTASGACCPSANVTSTGICCSRPVGKLAECPAETEVVKTCAAGYSRMPDRSCCNNRFISADGRFCVAGQRPCGPGEIRDRRGVCVPVVVPVVPPQPACPRGEERTRDGGCAPVRAPACPPGEILERNGRCVSAAPPPCPPGETRARDGRCVSAAPPACPRGEERTRDGDCVPIAPASCPAGETRARDGRCIPAAPPACPRGERRTPDGECVPIGPEPCPPGLLRNPRGFCVPAGPSPCPPGFARNLRGVCVPNAFAPCPPRMFRNRFGVCVPFGAPGGFGPGGPGFIPPRGSFSPGAGSGFAPLRQ